MKSVVLAGYARSPFCPANKGSLAKVRPDDLAASVVRGLVERTGVNVNDIEDLKLGCALPEGEQGLNMARLVVFLSGLPQSVGGITMNRFCGSSMQAVHDAAGAIQMGAGEAFICAGVESMSRVPMTGFNPLPNPVLYRDLPAAYMGMVQTADIVAQKYGISRADQEAFALQSHFKAAAAQVAGRFNDEIVPYNGLAADGKTRVHVDADGCIRKTSAELLARMKPVNEDGVVTAGTSSPLTDGAAAVLVASEDYARAHGLPMIAKIRSVAVSGCAPEIMGIGPVEASRKALKRAGLSINDIDVMELNEAFAAQALACIRELGIDVSRVNLDGGASALGHPLGATGARIVGKAGAILQREGQQFALVTQCIGGGQGIATVLEALKL